MLDKIFDKTIDQIVTPIKIGVYQKEGLYVDVSALWDTGASISSVSRSVASKLGLSPLRQIEIGSATGTDVADVCVCRFVTEDGVTYDKVALILPIQCPDVIIGLDIIKKGNFSLTNGTDSKGDLLHFTFSL